MRSLRGILVAAALAAMIDACAAISGLNAYTTHECASDCEGDADGTIADGAIASDSGGMVDGADGSASTEDNAIRDENEAASDTMDRDSTGGGEGGDAEGGSATEGGDASDAGFDGEGGCATGLLDCDGGCIKATTVSNCGSCGNQCTTSVANANPTCVNASCGFACRAGHALCAGACVQLTTASNCGSCGHACSADSGTPLCSGSATDGGMYSCVSGCSSGTPTLCGTACVDTTKDVNHCGACGTACTTNVANATAACVSSACTFTCDSGFTQCGGACVDTTSDNSNCGTCGNTCGSGQTCQSSSCKCNASSCPACGGTPCCRSTTMCGCNWGFGCF